MARGMARPVAAIPPQPKPGYSRLRLGVGQMPRSMTLTTVARSPATTADRTIGPEDLVSRQTRMRHGRDR